ncbi:MAG: hypothetical protein H6581_26745 [Bacteroidia bacterium]|nr:hypothetical protein [Bacteroidia bacterium]
MKSIYRVFLLGLVALTFSLSAKSQASLEFNQVIHQTVSGTVSGAASYVTLGTTTLTVPAGKVWKISAARARWTIYSGNITGYCSGDPIGLYLDDVNIFYSVFSTSNYANYENPIWLPAGTYTLDLRGYTCTSTAVSAKGFISAIEFDVVP